MIIYEVRLQPEPEILSAFVDWLQDHIAAMIELPGFTGAQLFADDPMDPEHPALTVHYELTDQAAMQRYFDEFAASMRAQAQGFAGRFKADRRVLKRLASWD